MQGFTNLTRPTLNPSLQNAIQAGGLSHTGNSFRPVGSPVKVYNNNGELLSGVSGGHVTSTTITRPRANPIRSRGINGALNTTVPATPIFSRPIANPVHGPQIRGVLGS